MLIWFEIVDDSTDGLGRVPYLYWLSARRSFTGYCNQGGELIIADLQNEGAARSGACKFGA